MKRLVYQVCLGESAQSRLYEFCIESVKSWCQKHGFDHYKQTKPILRVAPDPFSTNRSREATAKHGGFLPIYEKENAFDSKFLDVYDQIAIIDADIFVRPDAPNIFEEFGTSHAWGGVVEREMPINDQYVAKIQNYSMMQYSALRDVDWKWNDMGAEFFNMGMIVFNTEKLKPYLKGQTPKQFINRFEFKNFVDGVGNWKWSTDQTLLNYWLKKERISVKHLDWRWNGLYTANTQINDAHFVHFFLKDKLPGRGENIDELMMRI